MDKRRFLNRSFLYVQKTVTTLLVFSFVFTDLASFLFHIPLDVVPVTHAATGDFSIFRENGGTQTIETDRSTYDVDWDTTVQSDSNIVLQGNNSDIDLADGGKYLVTYNTKFEQGTSTTGSNRRSVHSWLTLDGTELPYGRASNYLRDTDGLEEAYISGGTIIDASAGEDLQLHLARDDINTSSAGTNIAPDTNAINVLKLKDSWDYLRIHQSATTTNVHSNTSFTNITWDTADEVATSTFAFTTSTADVTLSGDAGSHFLVTANVTLHVNGTASTRQNYEMQFTLDGTEVPATRVTAYPRGNQSGEEIKYATLSYMGIITKTSGSDQDLNLEMRRESTSSQVTEIVPDQTALSIVALPDTGSYIRLVDDSGSQTPSNATQDMTWNTQQEVDTVAFSHSTTSGSDVINIDAAGDYLFFATAYATTTNGDNNRQPFTVNWKEDGSVLTRGSFGSYNRNNGTNSGGSSGAILFNDLTTSSFIELQHLDESANAPDTSTFSSNRIGIQGILLDENFYGTDVFVSATGTHTVQANIPTTNFYTGGQYVIKEDTTARFVSNIAITESGTVDGSSGLENIELWYDYSTTTPYDCSEHSFDGNETQYGSTDANGFSGANGTSNFTGSSVTISPTQSLCVYPVVDVTDTASDGETVAISIDNPTVDVVVTSGGSIGPATSVAPTGSTSLQSLGYTQIHYHWRNDDGTESGATSATGGAEDTALPAIQAGSPKRLRMAVSHEGSLSYPNEVSVLSDFATSSTRSVPSGSNRLLVVGIHSEDSASKVNIDTVSYGGQQLTEVRDEQITTVASNGTWVGYLDEAGIAAASGSTIVPTWGAPGTPDDSVMFSSVVLEYVDQDNPVSGWSANSLTSVSAVQPTTTIAVADGDQTLYFTTVGVSGQTHTPSSGYTEGTEEIDTGGTGTGAANARKTITAGGTEQPTATWTGTNNRQQIVALNVQFMTQRDGLAQYKLQYAEKVSSCSAVSTWTDVAEDGGHWDTADSANLTFAENTTDIAESIGGVSNPQTFTGVNGVLDTGDTSLSTTLGLGEFIELEYTVVPTVNATEGTTYCFRTIDATPDVTHSHRIPLTIQSSQIDSTLTDFPVYVNLADLGSQFFSTVTSDGGDIRVTESDGLTEVPREIVSISTGGGTGEMYFKASSLSSTQDTTFYIYYGDSSANDYASSSVYGSQRVWDDNYLGVYHLLETSSGAADEFTDSSGAGNHGVGEQTLPTPTTGFIGTGQNFTENGLIDLGAVGIWDTMETNDAYTLSAWVNPDSTTNDQSVVSAWGGGGTTDGILFWHDIGGGGVGYCNYVSTYMPSDCVDQSDATTGSWQQVVAVYDGGTGGVYYDNTLTGSGLTAATLNAFTDGAAIGAINDSASGAQGGDTRYLDGQIDEVRISDIYRGADWIGATFINQSTSTDFYSTSTEEVMARSSIDLIYNVYPEASISSDVSVTATGTQTASLVEPSTSNYVGGAFAITENSSSRSVTDITITASGTIDASQGISNVTLQYDLDTSNPYDCASESYGGAEPQFGSVDVDGFSSANGTSTFASSTTITTTQTMCVYVIVDITASSSDGETLDVYINNPSTDVVASSGSVGPGSAVHIDGMSTITGPILTQTHFHWRNDNGDETDTGATSATDGSEDTALPDVPKESIRRLRLQVSNEGTVSSQSTQYRLEYGTKISTCQAIGVWSQVGVGSAFNMATSTFIADGNTTDIDNAANGAMTEENTTFVGTGALREDSSESGGITLSSTQYTELEYSIEATIDSGYDTDYCFRVTNSGAELEAYSSYAELTTREKQDFFIQRGTATTSGTSITLTAGVDYTAPLATSSAFVRITNSQMTGAGNDTGVNGQQADDVTAYISDQSDITSSFTVSRPSSATSNTRVDWEIVEFVGLAGTDNEMIVRSVGEASVVSTEFTVSGATVSGVVDDSDVVVFITGQQNQSAATNNYNDGQFTAAWNATTSQPDFERGDADTSADLGYAVVEFTGANWKIQRVEHSYTAAGSTETEPIEALTAPTQAFVHAQKRIGEGLQGIDEGGHQVWISSSALVSFELRSTADTPSGHVSVAWVVENTQTGDGSMVAYPSSGVIVSPTGVEPESALFSIGGTVNTGNASIFATSYSEGTGTSYPRLQAAFNISSSTHYELWRSDTNNDIFFRVDVVEWPVAELSIRQNYYSFYVDNNAVTPTDPWPAGASNLGENTSITATDDPLGEGEVVRIRMSLLINNTSMPENISSFKLQFGRRVTSCAAVEVDSLWVDLGDPGSGAIWRGYDGTPADGTSVATSTPAAGTLTISISDVAGTYEEQNNSTVNPYAVDIGQDVEYDWVVEHNGAVQKSDYCFRMVESDGTELAGYNNYPTLRTTGYTPIVGNWRFYDDETNETPSSDLAVENVAPTDIVNDNILKLRVTATEVEGAPGANLKFALQYSEYADFSDGGAFLTSTTSCVANSLWCYADGAGVDNQTISTTTLSDVDACVLGVGDGCGSHNEVATTTSSLSQSSLSSMEMEFTLRHAGARANAVYYFRLYDITNDDPLVASSSFPSVVTEGANLSFSVSGLPSGTVTEGVTTDVSSSPSNIGFSSLLVDTEYEAAHRLTVDTNATQGYQMFVSADQGLVNSYLTPIDVVTGTNVTPSGWGTGCLSSADGCFGYHAGDDSLQGGSARFGADDSYAGLTTTPQEIMYSSIPTNESHDIVYKIQVTESQPAGDYETNISYIAVPVF